MVVVVVVAVLIENHLSIVFTLNVQIHSTYTLEPFADDIVKIVLNVSV